MPHLNQDENFARYEVEIRSISESIERQLKRTEEAALKAIEDSRRAALEMPKDIGTLLERAAVVLTRDLEVREPMNEYRDDDKRPRLENVGISMQRGSLWEGNGGSNRMSMLEDSSGYARGPTIVPGRYRALFVLLPLPSEK